MPVHLRVNDKDTSRNPFINFLTALPGSRHDEALRRLQQLAAMAKPLMQDQGFHINSLEEYEWNRQFAGRCWNNGEVIELVLTSAKGEWIPLQYVLYVFCHELAHIKHMNHIPRLHGALTRHLKELALEKQRQGYYGDGMWSAGRSLASGTWIAGMGMAQAHHHLPEHVCGGAFGRTRRATGGRRRSGAGRGPTVRRFRGPSLHTGAQTAANTRGGNRRVKLETGGPGSRVDGQNHIPRASANDPSYKLDRNSTFRKRTQAKDAREMRAMAAQARIATDALDRYRAEKEEGESSASGLISVGSGSLLSSDRTGDKALGEGESDTEGEDSGEETDVIPITQAWQESNEERSDRTRQYYADQGEEEQIRSGEQEWEALFACGVHEGEEVPSTPCESEPTKRKGEALDQHDRDDADEEVVVLAFNPAKRRTAATYTPPPPSFWTCLLCTLRNDPSQRRCGACDTTRGKSTLGG